MSRNHEVPRAPGAHTKKKEGRLLTLVLTLAFVAAVGVFLTTTVACDEPYNETVSKEKITDASNRLDELEREIKNASLDEFDKQASNRNSDWRRELNSLDGSVFRADDLLFGELSRQNVIERIDALESALDVEFNLLELEDKVNDADDATLKANKDAWLKTVNDLQQKANASSAKVSDEKAKDWNKRLDALKDKLNREVTSADKNNNATISREPSSNNNVAEVAPGGTPYTPPRQQLIPRPQANGNTVVPPIPQPVPPQVDPAPPQTDPDPTPPEPEKSHDASLASLNVTQYNEPFDVFLSPAFLPTVYEYTLTVEPYLTLTDFDFAAVPNDSKAKVEKTVEAEKCTIVVTAEDGVTKNTYTINRVEREKSHDATLLWLGITAGGEDKSSSLNPAFSPDVFSYTIETEAWISSYTFSPLATDGNATVTQSSTQDKCTIVVTAEDGVTTNTYTITRILPEPEKSHDATLASINITQNGLNRNSRLTPPFVPNTLIYSFISEISLTAYNFLPIPVDPKATFAVNCGNDVCTIVVTAEDGVTTKTYTFSRTGFVIGG